MNRELAPFLKVVVIRNQGPVPIVHDKGGNWAIWRISTIASVAATFQAAQTGGGQGLPTLVDDPLASPSVTITGNLNQTEVCLDLTRELSVHRLSAQMAVLVPATPRSRADLPSGFPTGIRLPSRPSLPFCLLPPERS